MYRGGSFEHTQHMFFFREIYYTHLSSSVHVALRSTSFDVANINTKEKDKKTIFIGYFSKVKHVFIVEEIQAHNW